MTTLTEGRHTGEFLLFERAPYSREEVTIAAAAGAMVPGTVVGKIDRAASATSAANAGNTGSGTMGTITVTAGTAPGKYKLIITEAVTNAGNFIVEGPDGKLVGEGAVAAAFSKGGLAFTLADGSPDFALGDGFVITVAGGSGKYVAYDPAATDGSGVAAGITRAAVPDSASDQKAVIIARHAEVMGAALTGNDAAGTAALAALGILVR